MCTCVTQRGGGVPIGERRWSRCGGMCTCVTQRGGGVPIGERRWSRCGGAGERRWGGGAASYPL